MSIFSSSTTAIPRTTCIPAHIAIIMDGNGRWARKRFLPRVAGHKRGVDMVKEIIKACDERKIGYLTLFAFSSENWRRPKDEVSLLMELFCFVLEHEIHLLHSRNVRLKIIGDLQPFDDKLRHLIRHAEALTQANTGLTVSIAVNYGGRWDILQAISHFMRAHPERSVADLTEQDLAPYLSLHYAPEPDLFIRTGGEQRISNFLLWQLAYTELYFTDTLWPEFNATALDDAIASFQKRERRYGRTSEQLASGS